MQKIFTSIIPFIAVGLEPLSGFQGNKNRSPNDKLPTETDNTQIPMEIDADTSTDDIHQSTVNDDSTVPPVDLESELANELREFLESDPTSLVAAAADDVGIDQMLMA